MLVAWLMRRISRTLRSPGQRRPGRPHIEPTIMIIAPNPMSAHPCPPPSTFDNRDTTRNMMTSPAPSPMMVLRRASCDSAMSAPDHGGAGYHDDGHEQRLRHDARHCSIHVVGLAGFEPTTSCPPDKRANQAAPQPELFMTPGTPTTDAATFVGLSLQTGR